VVTLKAEALKDLAAGEHELNILFDDGNAALTMKVSERTSSPDTGDETPALVCAALTAGILSAAFALIPKRRRRDE
jgi:hypothetical protein